MNKVWKTGGCHCGAVQFRARATWDSAILCNCSICTKKGFLHVIVTKDEFELLQGQNELTEYRFGTRTARHLFCKHCGISSFYVPRSHPDGYSVNLRCVDDIDLTSITLQAFDGRHWEQQIHTIAS